MHVIYTISSIDPRFGGPARSLPGLAAAVSRNGVDAEICSLDIKNSAAHGQKIIGLEVPITSVESCGIPSLKLYWSTKFQGILENRTHTSTDSIIHDNGVWQHNNHIAVRVARQTKTPLIVTPRGMLTKWSFNHKALKKSIAWYLFQKGDLLFANAIHVTSESEARDLLDLGLKNPLVNIPNGTSLPKTWRLTPNKQNKHTMLFLSRLHPKKGLPILIESLARVRPQGWRLIIAGPNEDNHQQEIEALIKNAKLDDICSFTGDANDQKKDELFSSADLFVLATHSENFGMVVAEALSYGVPVITTKGAPWEKLLSHRCGWWTDISTESFSAAISEATSLPTEELYEMGIRGRSLVEKEYSWDCIAKDMIEVYEWLLGSKQRPRALL